MTVETADDLTTAELARIRQTPLSAAGVARAQSAVEFGSADRAVSEDDYQRVADALSCGVAAVRAVAEVETARTPFLPDGTGRPSILFEAHIFNRCTNGRFLGAKDRHGVALAKAQWDRTLYGRDGAHQYERLEDACVLDRHAALMATSWGMFQIMGFNWKEAGFGSCEDMVAAMCAGPAAHLTAFQNFVRSKQLEETLRGTPPDFESFATKYNGSGDVAAYSAKMKSHYDTLMAGGAAPAPMQVSAAKGRDTAMLPVLVTEVTGRAAVPGHVSPVTSTGSIKMPDINYGAALGDAASSAAAGMVFGPPGGIVGGLIGFAVDVVPGLFPHLFGKNSAQVQAEVKGALAGATGGKTDVSDVRAAIAADPAKADEIRQRLAAIAAQADEAQRRADLEQMKLAFADTASARQQTADLAKAGSPIAWGAPVVSVLVLMTFAAVVLMAIGTKQDSSLVNVVLGTLGTMSTAVVTYWVGSSAGSAQKTALLARAQPIA